MRRQCHNPSSLTRGCAAPRIPAWPPAGFETKFRITFLLVKTTATAIGLVGTLLSLMAVAGLVTDRLWLRLTLALIVALVVPLIIADRLLPSDDQRSARGLPTDVLAIVWLGCTVCFAALAGYGTRPMLVREGDRLFADGYPLVARFTWWMAGTRVQLPVAQAPQPAASSSASAEPSALASAPAASSSAPIPASPRCCLRRDSAHQRQGRSFAIRIISRAVAIRGVHRGQAVWR